jgi:hypothetical protein
MKSVLTLDVLLVVRCALFAYDSFLASFGRGWTYTLKNYYISRNSYKFRT